MTTSSVERLEYEAEGSRMRVSELLDELRGRISPGEVVDQVMDFASDGAAGDFVRTLGRQVRNNPLPCVLIGAGLAWLMLGGGASTNGMVGRVAGSAKRAASRAADAVSHSVGEVEDRARRAGSAAVEAGARFGGRAEDAIGSASTTNVTGRVSGAFSQATERGEAAVGEAADRAGSTLSAAASTMSDAARRAASGAQGMAGAVRGAAASTSDALRDTVGGMRERAGDAVGTVADVASGAAQRMTDAAWDVGRSAGDVGRRAGTTLSDFFRDQPLIAAGLGLAIGALIGAALPSTEAEDRLVGETSDEVKARARQMAREQADKAKHVAEETYEAAKESVSDLASAASDSASQIAERAARAAEHEGFPAGTLRAEHHRESAQGSAGQPQPPQPSQSREGLTGSMTETGGAQADRNRDAIPHTGREGFGEGQEEEHTKTAGE